MPRITNSVATAPAEATEVVAYAGSSVPRICEETGHAMRAPPPKPMMAMPVANPGGRGTT